MPRASAAPRAGGVITLGVFGTALLYGDGLITPAISVLSAVEGLRGGDVRRSRTGSSRSAIAHPRRPVRRPATRHGRRSRGVRPGDDRVVHGARRPRARARSSSIPSVLRAVSPDLRRRPVRRPPVARRSSPSARSSSSSPAVRRCTPTWDTSAGARSRSSGTAWCCPALLLNYFGQAALLADEPEAIEKPVLRHRARVGHHPARDPRDDGDGDRVAGADHRRLLPHGPGSAARLPPAPRDPPHVSAHRSDRSTCRS